MGLFSKGFPMGMSHRGAGATQETMRGSNEKGEIPWACPFFPLAGILAKLFNVQRARVPG